MNIELLTEIVAIVVPAFISVAASISACVTAFKGIKASEGRIKEANSATNLGKLTKAVEQNAELNRGLSAENNKLVKECRDLNAANKSLIENYAGKENEYSILADQTKKMMRFIESYKAQSQADHDAVVKLVNASKAELIDGKYMLEVELKNLREENEALKADVASFHKKLDEIIATRRAR